MSKLYKNAIELTAGFSYTAEKPLDDRLVVDSYSDLQGLVDTHAVYDGMVVAVKGDYRTEKANYDLYIYDSRSGFWSKKPGITTISGGEIFNSITNTSSYMSHVEGNGNNNGEYYGYLILFNGTTGESTENPGQGTYELNSVKNLNVNQSFKIGFVDTQASLGLNNYIEDYNGKILSIDTENNTVTVDKYIPVTYGTTNNIFITDSICYDITSDSYVCAIGSFSHIEGSLNTSLSTNTHVEGYMNNAYDKSAYSHAEGINNKTYATNTHIEGKNNIIGNFKGIQVLSSEPSPKEDPDLGFTDDTYGYFYISLIENLTENSTIGVYCLDNSNTIKKMLFTIKSIDSANKKLYGTTNNIFPSFGSEEAEYSKIYLGSYDTEIYETYNIIIPDESNFIGNDLIPLCGQLSHVEGINNIALSASSHVEGEENNVKGNYSHAEGKSNTTFGDYSHSEGGNNSSLGEYSHAEGNNNSSVGDYSHSEGSNTKASGIGSHTENFQTTASGLSSHAEGSQTTASGNISHAEGYYSTASGDNSHAQGYATKALGNSSHSEGYHTIAASKNQHVQGRYNIEDNNDKYAHIVGNGSENDITGEEERSNAHTLDWNGNAWFAGDVTATVNGSEVKMSEIAATVDPTQLKSNIIEILKSDEMKPVLTEIVKEILNTSTLDGLNQ